MVFLLCLGCGLLTVGPAVAALGKSNAHERWRELLQVERWFMPGATGREPGATPPPLGDHAFLTRALGGTTRANDGGWAEFNRLTPRLAFSHNLNRVFPPALHAEHPEFFPEEKGRRIRPPEGAGWWNPDLGRDDVAAYAAEAARAHFRAQTDAVSFALGVNDALIFGDSAETRELVLPLRWFRGRPDFSNLVFTFMNRVAARTAPEFPDKYVGALAYYWCEQAPDFPVDPHVIPFLTADRAQGYDPAYVAEDQALQKRWVEALRAGQAQAKLIANSSQLTASSSKLISPSSQLQAPSSQLTANSSKLTAHGLRLGLYDYIYGHGFLIPRLHPHLLAEHLRYTRDLGFTDYFAEMTPNWGLDGPQPWLVAQLLQDPTQNPDRLLNEYYRRYFKEAAGPMRRFYARCEEIWLGQEGPTFWLKFYRNEHQAVLFPPEVCAELRALLDEAAAVARRPVVRERVRQVGAAFGVTERFVTMQTVRTRLNRALLAGEGEPTEWWRDLLVFRAARAEFERYTQDLQAREPLLIAPFRWDDYLKHDPTVNTLVRLARAGFVPEPDTLAPEEARLLDLLRRPPHADALMRGRFTGTPEPVRRLTELDYSLPLPAPWFSKVEPVQHHRVELRESAGAEGRRLFIAGQRNTSLSQWGAVRGAEAAVARVRLRGHMHPGAMLAVAVGWLDAKDQHLAVSRLLLPPGEWPDWVELYSGDLAPAGAMRVGVAIHLINQEAGDWIEIEEVAMELR